MPKITKAGNHNIGLKREVYPIVVSINEKSLFQESKREKIAFFHNKSCRAFDFISRRCVTFD